MNSEWHIYISDKIHVRHPARYRSIEMWEKWGIIQVEILSRLKERLPNSFTYLRVHSFLPHQYKDVIQSCSNEIINLPGKEGAIFLFPDCEDKQVWQTFLKSAGLVPLARCIFMLDRTPSDWKEVIQNLYEVAQNLEHNQLVSEFNSELSICHCLCYSLDEDLVIAKIDLSNDTVLAIIEEIAHREGMQLVMHK